LFLKETDKQAKGIGLAGMDEVDLELADEVDDLLQGKPQK